MQAKRDAKETARYAAALAWDGDDAHMPEAVHEYQSKRDELGLKRSGNPQRDIRKWHARRAAEGNVHSHSSLAGPHPSMPDAVVLTIIEKMKHHRDRPTGQPFDSIQQLRNEDPEVDSMIQQAGISNAAVSKRVHKLRPTMKRAKLTVKKILIKPRKQARLKVAKKRKKISKKQQRAWVFIDAKSMNMEIKSAFGWIDTADEIDIAELQHAASKGNKVTKLDYYIGVGYIVGPLDLMFYTGTTGLHHWFEGGERWSHLHGEMKCCGGSPAFT